MRSRMGDLRVRPIRKEDRKELDEWRMQYQDGDLDLPHGYLNEGVETAVAEKEGKLVGSLTAVQAVNLDTFIHDPNASGIEVIQALIKLETALSYQAAGTRAADMYIAVPNHLRPYLKILEKYGYSEAAQNCVIMRKPLYPDSEPLMSEVRGKLPPLVIESVESSDLPEVTPIDSE